MASESAHNSGEAAAARLRAALEMFETGVEMMRQTIRRNNPGLTELEIDARVRAWLMERPGAPFGDTVGRPVAWPRRPE